MPRSSNLLINKLRKAVNQLPYLRRTFGLIWAASRSWTIAWLILLVVQGVLPVATVYLTRLLVNSLMIVLSTPNSMGGIRLLILSVILMAVVLLVQSMLGSLSNMIRTAQSERVKDSISGLIHKQSITVDLAFYESPDYYDHLHRARIEAIYRPVALLESTGSLLQSSITLIAMAFVLISYAWWLPLALLVSTLPAVYIVLHHRLRLHRWRMETTRTERRAWYYEYLLTTREVAAELRLFHLGDNLRSTYQELRKRLREERQHLAKDQGFSEMVAGVIAVVIIGLAMIWMLWQVILGKYLLGDLAMFYSAFNQGQSLLRSLLEQVGEIYSNSLFLGDLFEFLELEPRVAEAQQTVALPPNLIEGIRFENVTFSYPENQRRVLDEFNLVIPAGQIAAIVGPNGAGKSTLLKLLCRFYDPPNGTITLDGIDLRDFSLEDLRRHITVLFQEPVDYQETVRQNIALGDIFSGNQDSDIRTAAAGAGADTIICQLPDGYETLLGKWFEGGVDLSVGEWQRIALARAFLRKAPIIVLDEPTSAMDPWAEADWLKRFRRLAEGRTAIVITHRFTTAAFADVIHVMDNGHIVESGNHLELLDAGGRYAESWHEQLQRWTPPARSDGLCPGKG